VIRFDKHANLWVTVGDNGGSTAPGSFSTANPFAAANTASPFGKILRVKPKPLPDAGAAPAPGAGSTYDIPEGNLFPSTAQALPEIYVMGTRNPYTLSLDSVRGAIGWGDIGPDAALNNAALPQASTDPAKQAEEFNFTTTPGNFGWPYWAGNQVVINAGGGTPAAP